MPEPQKAQYVADVARDSLTESQELPAPQSGRNRESGALRARIVEVATEMFANRGFGATSMREVTAAAGCTKPALYYYFDSKAALFLAIIREETDRIRALLEQQLSGDGSIRQRMRTTMAAYLNHVRQEPMTLRVLMRAELHTEHGQPSFDFRSVRQTYRELSLQVLHEAVHSGEIRSDVDLDDALAAFSGMLDYRCTLWLADGEPIPDDYPDRIITLLFGGLAP